MSTWIRCSVPEASHVRPVIVAAARQTYAGADKFPRKPRMTTPLDPVIAQIIPLLPLRDPETMTPQSARDALRALAAARAAVPPPPVMSAADAKVKGAAEPLAARVYRVSHEKSPTVVFFHGGGWVAGDLETHDRQARLLAIETGAVVVSVDYRRPPETRFPGAFEDGFAAVRDVIGRIAEFGGDLARVGVAGDSAGGNLAAAVAIACRDAGIKLAAQLLVYPVTDVAGNYADAGENARFPSRTENAEGYFLSRAVMEWFAGHYLDDVRHGADWRVSPLRAKTLAGLAPAIVCTAWFDPLRDEGDAYAAALQAAGVDTRHYRGAGLIHGYFGLGEASETARREAERARADFRSLLERGA
jgi:acetyl esterase